MLRTTSAYFLSSPKSAPKGDFDPQGWRRVLRTISDDSEIFEIFMIFHDLGHTVAPCFIQARNVRSTLLFADGEDVT